MKKKSISLLILFYSSLFANSVTKVEQLNSDLNLTIYNNDIAMITEERKVNYKEGVQQIIYENVPSSIIQESIRPSFGSDLTLYSQNYSFDTITFDSLSKYYVGKKISYINYQNKIMNGLLLSENPLLVKDTLTKEVFVLTDLNKIIFPEVPESMSLKPNISWLVDNKKENNSNLKINYLSNGFSWNSNYTLSLNKNSSLNGWITVTNNSGVDYPNANLTFLAGDINLVNKNTQEKVLTNDTTMVMTMAAVSTPEIKEVGFSNYYLYKIPFKETLKDKETKQISFINKNNIKYKEYAKTSISTNIFNRSVIPLEFDNNIEIENIKDNGLGLSLPKGTIRVFKEDNEKIEQFVGESEINNISNKDKFSINIGKMFDINGEYKVVKQETNTNHMYHEKSIKISNKSKEKAEIKIEDIIQQGNNKVISTNTCEADKKCVVKEIAKNLREITISLKPNEDYIFNITYDIIF